MSIAVQLKEPPQPVNYFIVDREAAGCWRVRDARDQIGGIFVSKKAAMHFARRESNGLPGAVICIADIPPHGSDMFLPRGVRLSQERGTLMNSRRSRSSTMASSFEMYMLAGRVHLAAFGEAKAIGRLSGPAGSHSSHQAAGPS